MITEKIDLYKYYNIDRQGASGGYITVYARNESSELKKRIRPAILVIPGGAYTILSDREGEPVALKFVDKGYVSFVLEYSVQTKYPTPLNEALMAMAYIRDNAEKYGVDKDHICTVGFSAGGHLCGLLATAKQNEAILNRNISELKPNAVVLSYPVVTMGEYTHIGTRDIITGGDSTLCDLLSVEKRVDDNSAPSFIWHTYEDDGVPTENSLLLASAYRKNNVPFALHIFEHGWHGLSLANDEVCDFDNAHKHLYKIGKWVDLAVDWLTSRGFVIGK